MALSGNRVLLCGVTPHTWEQEAIEFVKAQLPDGEPYRIWALFDLVEPSGRRYDVDLLVLGRHALYLIEIKSYPGAVRGDTVDWTITFPDGGRILRECPLRLTEHKARVLASLLDRRLPREDRPRVEALVFLSDPGIDLHHLTPTAQLRVLKRPEIARALTHAEFRGADARLGARVIDTRVARSIQDAIRALGITPSRAAARIGENVLDAILEEGPGYQDREAHHERIPERRCRVRSYLIPQATTQERRDQLLRAAQREARLLTMLSEHRGILHPREYLSESPLGGPCILFEHWPDACDLGTFLRRSPDLPFSQRISLLQQIGEALDYCHRKQVLHRGLHPGAVLVRRNPDAQGAPEVRLYNFQLASHGGSHPGTVHLSSLSPAPAALYRAPEVLEDPDRATPLSDVFSLGAIAYHLLTGRAPGATLDERDALLRAGGGRLSVAAARDDLARLGAGDTHDLDEIIGFATSENPVERLPVMDWLNLLLTEATAPPQGPAAQRDPLEARPGDALGGDLEVRALLGTGSTASVLRVQRGETLYALKVALSADLEERLRQEAEILARLDSDRIVSIHGELVLGERRRLCLLLRDAGETLADLLAREGPLSLDYAQRWGEDLLWALSHLEEKVVQHRDIKPANLGVLTRESKRARHLLLFDFSLSPLEASQITAGTPAYRDPFLVTRGRWDEAADRYAAAVTIYEMLTGVRPRQSQPDLPATVPGQEAVIEADRFDAAARDRLLAFFRRAFTRDAALRHDSAASMRREWMACFAGPLSAAPPAASPQAAPDLSRASPDTPVAALSLSVRARNALDRSGVITVRELLALPRNQLSLIRGVGRGTVTEILKFLDDYHATHPATGAAPDAAPAAEGPYHPGYRGVDAAVSLVPELLPDAAEALTDAGLGRLSLIAAAPRPRVERLLARHGARAAIDGALGRAAQSEGPAGPAPPTVEAWLEALVPAPRKRGDTGLRHTRLLLGLDTLDGAVHTDAGALSQALGVSRQMVYASLNGVRKRWRDHPEIDTLVQKVEEALAALGGIAPLGRVGDGLPALVPHDAGAGAGGERRAQALARIAAIAGEEAGRLVLGRLRDVLWLAPRREHLEVARQLGGLADVLSRRDPLPSSEEVRDALQQVVAGTPLGGLLPERLVSLAAEASLGAAPSARLELYPRGLAAARALSLCSGAFGSDELRPEDIRRVVAARYPAAEPPPPRPALDGLVATLGLTFHDARGLYLRPHAAADTSAYTHLERRPTMHSLPPRPTTDPDEQEAREFDERLRLLARRGAYRVLKVPVVYAEEAATQIARRLGVLPCSLDRELLRTVREQMARRGVKPERVYQADQEGPGSVGWTRLCQLMGQSATELARRLLAEPGPLVLTHPGLLARYELTGFLQELVEGSQRDDAPAVLLLVAGYDEAGPAAIAGPFGQPLPVPTMTGAPPLPVPVPWLENRHRGAA